MIFLGDFSKSRFIQIIFFSMIIMFIFLINVQAEKADIIKLSEIEAGMKGTAKTVFSGYEVESFPVEVINLLEDQGLDRTFIIIKVSGEQIERTGGISSGMSGSPVYIDGRLAGAIGYGWQGADNRYGLVTPIESMLKLLPGDFEKDDNFIDNPELIHLKTPLYVSGLSGRSLARTESLFEDYGFKVISTGNYSALDKNKSPELEAGSAVAVQLTRGDVSIASIGTLTYMDNNNILAFGHPFLNKGEVDYLLSRAYISTVIPGDGGQPFKLGSATDELIGVINNDRGAGVSGYLKKFPRIIPLQVKVKDKDRQQEKEVNVQMIKDEDVLTSLVTNVSMEAVDAVLDRIGRGTAEVSFKITGTGLPDMLVKRENTFYSDQDIAATAIYEIYQYLNIITSNPFEKVNFIDIQLDIEVDKSDSIALVQEARVINEEVYPGDILQIEVDILPYRGKSFTRTILFELPENVSSGRASLTIEGGFIGGAYQTVPQQDLGSQQEYPYQDTHEGYKDLESIIDDLTKQPLNNELVVSLYPGYAQAASPMGKIPEEEQDTENDIEDEEKREEESGEEIKEEARESQPDAEAEDIDGKELLEEEAANNQIQETYKTDYVLEGNLMIDLEIDTP